MKQKSGWKRITLLRKTSFKKRLKILAGYKRQPFPYRIMEELPVTRAQPWKRYCRYGTHKQRSNGLTVGLTHCHVPSHICMPRWQPVVLRFNAWFVGRKVYSVTKTMSGRTF